MIVDGWFRNNLFSNREEDCIMIIIISLFVVIKSKCGFYYILCFYED